jgi:hypothetical protein
MKDLTINVSKQFDGFTFSITPLTRRSIMEEFPSAHPIQSMAVSFDTTADFNQQVERIEKYIYLTLTGIPENKENLKKVENIRFVDPLTKKELYSSASLHVEE